MLTYFSTMNTKSFKIHENRIEVTYLSKLNKSNKSVTCNSPQIFTQQHALPLKASHDGVNVAYRTFM